MKPIRQALKEWAIAVSALEQGETILLLRKGGIRETGGKFSVECDRVLLYPTYEHQKPELLKSHYSSQVQPVESGWHPQQVRIGSFADITHIFQVTEPEGVRVLEPFHVWNDRFIEERLKWKPKSPLYLLLLRVFRLPEAQLIDYHEGYGGCRSWIELDPAIDSQTAQPVLSDADYTAKIQQLKQLDTGIETLPSY
jgi:hypothetical protein